MKAKRFETEGNGRARKKELLDLRKAQFSLRMQAATQQLANHSQIGKTRKDIARVKTILNEGASPNERDDRKMRRTLTGRVVSDKMQRLSPVLIERRVKHPVIGKMVLRSKKYHAHVDNDEAKTGDLVQIEECIPMSKTKAGVFRR